MALPIMSCVLRRTAGPGLIGGASSEQVMAGERRSRYAPRDPRHCRHSPRSACVTPCGSSLSGRFLSAALMSPAGQPANLLALAVEGSWQVSTRLGIQHRTTRQAEAFDIQPPPPPQTPNSPPPRGRKAAERPAALSAAPPRKRQKPAPKDDLTAALSLPGRPRRGRPGCNDFSFPALKTAVSPTRVAPSLKDDHGRLTPRDVADLEAALQADRSEQCSSTAPPKAVVCFERVGRPGPGIIVVAGGLRPPTRRCAGAWPSSRAERRLAFSRRRRRCGT